MPKPKPRIGRRQRDGLYELARNHLGGLGDVWIALEREGDHEKAARLAREFGRDFRLLDDLGWEPIAPPESKAFQLTMPTEELHELLSRLAREGSHLLLGVTGHLAEDAASALTEERIECGYRAAVEVGETLRAGGEAR